MLTCYCCGEPYERYRWRCCKAPKGTPPHVWLGMHCTRCAPVPEQARCPRHCTCGVDRQPLQRPFRPLAELAEQVAARLLPADRRVRDVQVGRVAPDVTERMPYKDQDDDA
jgi:hypothetical protein